ncbi:peptide deformylase [Actinotalea sp.]|uniref:peptide deformylase n=1 Tax=Actinotalea sp. TaxID=1872145 RepID=UPI00356A4C3A
MTGRHSDDVHVPDDPGVHRRPDHPQEGVEDRVLRDRVAELLEGPVPLPIVQAGDPVLRRRAAPYRGQLGSRTLGRLVEAMRVTMLEAPGVGLAAPQVGVGLALAVIEDPGALDPELAVARERVPVPFRVVLNPEYTPVGPERVSFYEGCLSVAGWQAVRSRWRAVRLTGIDERLSPLDELLSGWPARIVQHETDHLAGELYLDGAELRSLLAPGEAWRHAGEIGPERAARELGFRLDGLSEEV